MSDDQAPGYSLTPRYSLTAERYLELVRADADLMADAASRLDLDAEVPPCPGWTVRDALLHTAEVYQHKISCTRFGLFPDPWPPEGWPTPEAIADPVGALRRSEGELLTELSARDPRSHSATWWPPDQSVGFWCRRMAHETAVHRVDVQSAGTEITAVDTDLALDGIDELLEMMLAGDWSDVSAEEWGDVDPKAGAGQPIDLRAGERHWRVVLEPDRIEAFGLFGDPIEDTPAAVTVTGKPSNLLLWAWGRLPETAVTVDGDEAAVAALRDRITLATQ